MALKKAFETTEKTAFAALLYGQTGVGKSTLACGGEKAIMIDFDNGLERVAIKNRVDYSQALTWDEAVADTQEAIKNGYKTVIVDTVGKMIDCIEAYIIANNPSMKDRKGGLTLKGFGLRKQIFTDYLKTLKSSGVNVVFVAQETESEEGNKKVRRPACGSDKMATELLQDIDIAGYIHVDNGKRVVEFGCVDYAWTKNSCGLPPSVTLADLSKGGENDAMRRIADTFVKFQQEKVKTANEYADTIAKIDELCSGAKTAEELTEVLGKVKDLPEVLTSKLYAKQALGNASTRIGCKWDKNANRYA